MNTNELRRIKPDIIHGPVVVLVAPAWPDEGRERDNLTSARPLREPHFNDGDLLEGDGP